jgi:hypothetical protein
MKLSEINPNSPRGIAYEKAKLVPGIEVKFQGEDGYRTTRYAKGTPAQEVMGMEIMPATSGCWYEKAVVDATKITEDVTIGFRVKDEPATE